MPRLSWTAIPRCMTVRGVAKKRCISSNSSARLCSRVRYQLQAPDQCEEGARAGAMEPAHKHVKKAACSDGGAGADV
jgi:hypothetical protein